MAQGKLKTRVMECAPLEVQRLEFLIQKSDSNDNPANAASCWVISINTFKDNANLIIYTSTEILLETLQTTLASKSEKTTGITPIPCMPLVFTKP